MSAASPDTLSNVDIAREIQSLQKRAFERYEDAALRAEADPARAEVIYAQAERDTAPWIARATALNDERVARYQRRAKRWRTAAMVIGVVGAVFVVWMMSRAG
jgi:hypothetical protein